MRTRDESPRLWRERSFIWTQVDFDAAEDGQGLWSGFVIEPRLIPHVPSWWYVSDRVAVINVAIPNPGGRFTECRVVNAYGPTMQKVTKNPAVRVRFYVELSSASHPGWQMYRNGSKQSWCHEWMVCKAVFQSIVWTTGPIHLQTTSTQSTAHRCWSCASTWMS